MGRELGGLLLWAALAADMRLAFRRSSARSAAPRQGCTATFDFEMLEPQVHVTRSRKTTAIVKVPQRQHLRCRPLQYDCRLGVKVSQDRDCSSRFRGGYKRWQL